VIVCLHVTCTKSTKQMMMIIIIVIAVGGGQLFTNCSQSHLRPATARSAAAASSHHHHHHHFQPIGYCIKTIGPTLSVDISAVARNNSYEKKYLTRSRLRSYKRGIRWTKKQNKTGAQWWQHETPVGASWCLQCIRRQTTKNNSIGDTVQWRRWLYLVKTRNHIAAQSNR